MSDVHVGAERVFKTAWFAKAARKARLADRELCAAITQVKLGQADDLGGGVFKKRLGKNLYRSIVVTKAKRVWVFAYLFAKKDRANITSNELEAFRRLADLYERKTEAEFDRELASEELLEICHGKEQ